MHIDWGKIKEMTKDNKWLMTAIVFVASLGILFGGFFIYQEFNVKAPLEEKVSSVEGVIVNEVNSSRETVSLDIEINQASNFQLTYQEVEEIAEPYLDGKELEINIENNASDDLMAIWNKSYFAIAEAIDRKEYSLVPQAIEGLEQRNDLNKAGYSMDEENIYIDLHNDDSSLYFVIPRESSMEVKNID